MKQKLQIADQIGGGVNPFGQVDWIKDVLFANFPEEHVESLDN